MAVWEYGVQQHGDGCMAVWGTAAWGWMCGSMGVDAWQYGGECMAV